MFALFVVVHIVVSLILILVVLLQSGKAGDLASAFGGAGSQTAFGARGAATVLTNATTICAILFMITSLGLAIMFNQGSDTTVMEAIPQSGRTSTEPDATEPAVADEQPAFTEQPLEFETEGRPAENP